MAGSSLIQTFFQESLAAGGIKIGLWVKPTLVYSILFTGGEFMIVCVEMSVSQYASCMALH